MFELTIRWSTPYLLLIKTCNLRLFYEKHCVFVAQFGQLQTILSYLYLSIFNIFSEYYKYVSPLGRLSWKWYLSCFYSFFIDKIKSRKDIIIPGYWLRRWHAKLTQDIHIWRHYGIYNTWVISQIIT